ncbi:hypothetical protein AN958_01398 [Leucoagaricus sp. SymC.cos]|nr:hypothetical protein AN958_01398 [Leucoagaricus sp. SymC.cos]
MRNNTVPLSPVTVTHNLVPNQPPFVSPPSPPLTLSLPASSNQCSPPSTSTEDKISNLNQDSPTRIDFTSQTSAANSATGSTPSTMRPQIPPRTWKTSHSTHASPPTPPPLPPPWWSSVSPGTSSAQAQTSMLSRRHHPQPLIISTQSVSGAPAPPLRSAPLLAYQTPQVQLTTNSKYSTVLEGSGPISDQAQYSYANPGIYDKQLFGAPFSAPPSQSHYDNERTSATFGSTQLPHILPSPASSTPGPCQGCFQPQAYLAAIQNAHGILWDDYGGHSESESSQTPGTIVVDNGTQNSFIVYSPRAWVPLAFPSSVERSTTPHLANHCPNDSRTSVLSDSPISLEAPCIQGSRPQLASNQEGGYQNSLLYNAHEIAHPRPVAVSNPVLNMDHGGGSFASDTTYNEPGYSPLPQYY